MALPLLIHYSHCKQCSHDNVVSKGRKSLTREVGRVPAHLGRAALPGVLTCLLKIFIVEALFVFLAYTLVFFADLNDQYAFPNLLIQCISTN